MYLIQIIEESISKFETVEHKKRLQVVEFVVVEGNFTGNRKKDLC